MKWLKEKVWGSGRTLMGCLIIFLPEIMSAFAHPMMPETAEYCRSIGTALAGIGLAGKLKWLAPYAPSILDAMFRSRRSAPTVDVSSLPTEPKPPNVIGRMK